jgi:hypothetical protein
MLAMPAIIDLGLTEPSEIEVTLPIVTVSEDETQISEGDEIPETSRESHEAAYEESSPNNQLFTFDVENNLGNSEPLIEDTHPEFSLAQQDLLHWHYRFNHLSFTGIQEMAKQRLLPARLAKFTIPLCSGCT